MENFQKIIFKNVEFLNELLRSQKKSIFKNNGKSENCYCPIAAQPENFNI